MMTRCSLSILIHVCLFQFSLALCHYGSSMNNPGKSCREILIHNPGCYGFSGHYWIQCSGLGSPVQVYCDMEYLQGGWMKVASENFTSGVPCPCEWVNYTVNDNNYCTTPNDTTIASWFIDTICPYSEVRGYVLVDQKGLCDGFQSSSLDGNYVDGISITYNDSNVRQHLYTYVVGREQKAISEACECHGATPNHHLFLLWDFMCDSGFEANTATASSVATRTLFTGEGCAVNSGCCHLVGAPWFYRSIPVEITSRLELRILSDGGHTDEMILVKEVELYVK